MNTTTVAKNKEVDIQSNGVILKGLLSLPSVTTGMVLFAHGSGSGRHSPRNQVIAEKLQACGFGTLLFDLLTAEEEKIDDTTREYRFDINFLTIRLLAATDWIHQQDAFHTLPLGYFGASTGAAAALQAAALRPNLIRVVVSRGGRPDLANEALLDVNAATLLIVGGNDREVIKLNERALALLACRKEISIVPGATHLFEEEGALERVAQLACSWCQQYLK